jgi:hypothetical protein
VAVLLPSVGEIVCLMNPKLTDRPISSSSSSSSPPATGKVSIPPAGISVVSRSNPVGSSAHLKDHGACHCHCHGSVPNSSSAHASNDSRDDVSWRHKTHLPDSSRRAVSILVKCTVQTDKMNIGQVRSASKTGPRCCFPELRGRISLKPNHASAPTPTETATKAAET